MRFLPVRSPGQRALARLHLPRRRAPRGGGARAPPPISDADCGSCRYKGLGAAAARPRARSARRGPEGGRAGGRGERTERLGPDRPDRGAAAEGRGAAISVGKRNLPGPRGAAQGASSTPRQHPLSISCRPQATPGPGLPRAHPRARARPWPSREPPLSSPPLQLPRQRPPGRDPGVSTGRLARSARHPEPPSTRTAPAGHTRMVTVGIALSPREMGRGEAGSRLHGDGGGWGGRTRPS